MNTWKVILATMVIFGTGVVTGGLLMRQARVVRAPVSRPPGIRPVVAPSPGGMRLEFLRRIQRELDLSRDQREQVDRILKASQERSKKIMEPVSPELRKEVQRTKEEFRSVLTPDQREVFDQLIKHPPRSPQRRPATPPAEKAKTESRPPNA